MHCKDRRCRKCIAKDRRCRKCIAKDGRCRKCIANRQKQDKIPPPPETKNPFLTHFAEEEEEEEGPKPSTCNKIGVLGWGFFF